MTEPSKHTPMTDMREKPMSEKQATCRGCGKKLDGKPYYMGGKAYDPITKKQAKVNFYGGFVCSERCDFNSSLELERSMPGHGITQKTLNDPAARSLRDNWPRSLSHD